MAFLQLPSPIEDQKYVTVSPLAAGFITLPEHLFVNPGNLDVKRTVPSLAFLICHPGTSKWGADPGQPYRMMFDLGLRKAMDRYPQALQVHISTRAPYCLEPGAAAQLIKGGLDPQSVDLVMLSHVHYDHHGDPEDFPNAQFVVGHGALDVLKYGLGEMASHQRFDPRTLPVDRSRELSDPETSDWKPLGPFPSTLDLFSDGSLYVIDTPGHLPGHLNLLCRMADRWVCLCGDAFHDPRLLTGEKEIGTWTASNGIDQLCIHFDRNVAAQSIYRLRELVSSTSDDVELIAAHDELWWEKNQEKVFPAIL